MVPCPGAEGGEENGFSLDAMSRAEGVIAAAASCIRLAGAADRT